MQNEKDNIKKWLKTIGKDRFWLAEKCLIEKTSVDNWFRLNGAIPEAKLALIKALMSDPFTRVTKKELLTLPSNFEALDRITIEVEGELQIRINQKALELGMTTSCWASLALEEAAGEPDIMERIERLYAKKNAERSKSGTSQRHNSYIQENQKADRPNDTGENSRTGTKLFDESGQEHKNENSPTIITGLSWEEETPA